MRNSSAETFLTSKYTDKHRHVRAFAFSVAVQADGSNFETIIWKRSQTTGTFIPVIENIFGLDGLQNVRTAYGRY